MTKGPDSSLTTMRLLYYPPLPPESEIKPGQLRCGEHVDYGSITLLFQDPIGGLQVCLQVTNIQAHKYEVLRLSLTRLSCVHNVECRFSYEQSCQTYTYDVDMYL